MIASAALLLFFAAYFFILAACDSNSLRATILSLWGLFSIVFMLGYLTVLVLIFFESVKDGFIALGISVGILIVAAIFYKGKDVPPPSDEWL